MQEEADLHLGDHCLQQAGQQHQVVVLYPHDVIGLVVLQYHVSKLLVGNLQA
jgi:hypothetical protein